MAGDNRKWFVLAGATLLYLATSADGPSFNTALPAIQEAFGASASQVQLLTIVAQMGVAAFVLAAGALGDLYGIKRVFLLGGAGLIVSLLLQAFAPSMGFLTLARGIDGIFSAVTTPLAVAMITMEFRGKERAFALGLFTAGVGLGEAFLPILAGWLTDTVGWRAVFVISISAAALAYVLIRQSARESKDPNAEKLDTGGVIISAIMMLGFVGSFVMAGNRGFLDPLVLAAMGVGLVFLLIFIRWEGRTSHPALRLSLFRNPVFLSSFLAGFAVFFVLMPLNPIMNLYFQDVLAYSAMTAAIALIPLSLGTTLSAPFAGKLTARLGSRNSILAGLAFMLAGTLLLSTLGMLPPYWIVGLGLALVAVGYGFANPPRVDALMSAAPDDIAGSASSANSAGTESGSAAGMALSTTLAMAFAGRAFINLGTDAGLSTEEIDQAEEVLGKVINEGMTTFPGVSQSTLDQLIEGAQTAFSTGVAQTMLFLSAILVVSLGIVWFGMRKPAEQPADKGS